MHDKYAQICKDMDVPIDNMQTYAHICKTNMQKYVHTWQNMQINMHVYRYEYTFYIHIHIQKYARKYAEICRNMDFPIENMQKYAINAKICNEIGV